MTAAAERQALGTKAQRIAGNLGSRGERRALAFARAIAGMPAENILVLADVVAAPDWLAHDRIDQRDLARRVALVSMADHIAASIDGEWLATLAKAAGEDAMDRAIAAAGGDATTCALPPGEAAGLEERGFALLRAALSPDMQPLLAWAPAGLELNVDRPTATKWVQLAGGAIG